MTASEFYELYRRIMREPEREDSMSISKAQERVTKAQQELAAAQIELSNELARPVGRFYMVKRQKADRVITWIGKDSKSLVITTSPSGANHVAGADPSTFGLNEKDLNGMHESELDSFYTWEFWPREPRIGER